MTILGAGVGGLSVGYYAKKNNMKFRILEAGDRIGGNCITFKHNDFLFDSGAHRFHDKERMVTREILSLLKDQIELIDVPSKIHFNGKLINFPLSPLNLISNLGLITFMKVVNEVLSLRLAKKSSTANFEKFARHTYGDSLANSLLLNYSEKLWGVPARKLSINIAGKRMEGLNLKTFIKEAFLKKKRKTEHLDGRFYYPEKGIGNLTNKVADFIGRKNIFLDTKITQVYHNNNKVTHLEINNKKKLEIEKIVNTIPLNEFLGMMNPLPPKIILSHENSLKFRDMILIAIFLEKESITNAATIYFPDNCFIFTRLYEPKNRHPSMAPSGTTSLVVEIPSQRTDPIWQLPDNIIIEKVKKQLKKIFEIQESEVIDSTVKRMYYAYPILEITSEKKANIILEYLKRFSNLKITGRNSKFQYIHIHDLFKIALEISQ